MAAWANFFLGELGAASALAGLLFVSVSMNQARILELGRMADRGVEALAILLLVLVIASLTLVPDQPLRLLGAEIFLVGTATLVAVLRLQKVYLSQAEPRYRRRSTMMAWLNRAAIGVIALAGLVVLWRGDEAGIYLLPAGILLSFAAAGTNAWVLLIEISR